MQVNILDFQILNSTNSQKQNIEIHFKLTTINWVKTYSINKNNSQSKNKTDHNFTVENPVELQVLVLLIFNPHFRTACITQ